jgi:Family of unknown function (DUF5681)
MSDRKVCKVNTRFKKGVSGNPKGRPKRRPPEIGEVMKGIMDGSVEYREGGRTRKATRRELSVKRHLKRALEGDIGAAEALLKLRAQAQEKGIPQAQSFNLPTCCRPPPRRQANHKSTARVAAIKQRRRRCRRPPTQIQLARPHEGHSPPTGKNQHVTRRSSS